MQYRYSVYLHAYKQLYMNQQKKYGVQFETVIYSEMKGCRCSKLYFSCQIVLYITTRILAGFLVVQYQI
jgi:hypothetical protein